MRNDAYRLAERAGAHSPSFCTSLHKPLVPRILRCGMFFIAMCFVPASAQEIGTLPKKAKLKAVLYESANVVGVGYVYKNRFVENQVVAFYSFPKNSQLKKIKGDYYVRNRETKECAPLSSLDTLTCGIYYVKADTAHIAGTLYYPSRSMYEGDFVFTNTAEYDMLTCEAKKAAPFSYSLRRVDKYRVMRGGLEISGRMQADGNYTLEASFPDDADNRLAKSTLTAAEVQDGVLNRQKIADVFNSRRSVNLYLKNGDSFTGTVAASQETAVCNIVPKNGKYRYATGETFSGMYQPIHFRNGRIVVPCEGTTTFADSITAEGDWLKRYGNGFTQSDWSEIYEKSNSLTDIRDYAAAKQREIDAEKRAKELAELRKQMEEKRRKEEAARKKAAKKRYYIAKYGEHYGQLIAECKLELGMTEEMVNEVYNKGIFDCSQASFFGQRVDTWVFNKTKMLIKVANEGGREAGAAMFLLNAMGITDMVVPYSLQFVNGKLTEISY